jgi:RNA:NAD 2'-phosphotransferase (TPT1/KptA family)
MRYKEIIEAYDRFASDQEEENSRLLAAYCKKHRIGRFDQLNMGRDEWDRIRAEALKNHNLYPVPKTDPNYLYHGTAKIRLHTIAYQGLLPQEKSRWSKEGYSRVFFADTISKAEFYASQASKSKPVILRVLRDFLHDAKPDTKEEEGCYFVEHGIPSSQIEIWTGKEWKKIVSMLKESSKKPTENYLSATPQNIQKAKNFVFKKWQERAEENGRPAPNDLSNSCKFGSLFAQKIFGGKLQGNYDHQYVVLPTGQIIDFSHDAEDVKKLKNPHYHDSLFWKNSEHKESMKSCLPRVNKWVEDFKNLLTLPTL